MSLLVWGFKGVHNKLPMRLSHPITGYSLVHSSNACRARTSYHIIAWLLPAPGAVNYVSHTSFPSLTEAGEEAIQWNGGVLLPNSSDETYGARSLTNRLKQQQLSISEVHRYGNLIYSISLCFPETKKKQGVCYHYMKSHFLDLIMVRLGLVEPW